MTKIFFASDLQSIEQGLWEIFQILNRDARGAVILADVNHVEAMDRLLWQRPQLAFMPHVTLSQPEVKSMPFLLAHQEELVALSPDDPALVYEAVTVDSASPIVSTRNLLINMDGNPLPVFAKFGGLIELIPSAKHSPHSGISPIESVINSARERFRHYRDRGYALTHVRAGEPVGDAFSAWWRTL